MILEYKFGSRQFWKYILTPFLKLLTVILIATIFGAMWFGVREQQVLMVVGLTWAWFFFIHLLPLLIIGAQHMRLSKDMCFIIDTINNRYQFKSKDRSLSFQLSEIDELVKVVSPPKYDKRIDVLGFGHFFYWKISLADGQTLAISCLVLDVEDFSGRKANKEKRLFPIPN